MKGFYVENTSDFFPTWNVGDPYLQFPDLKSITWGGSTGFVLNRDFSLRALLNRQEWQLESRGSLVPIIRYEFTKMTNNFEDDTYGKENIVDLRVGLGYYYNWMVAPKLNIAPSLHVGIGPKFSKYTLAGQEEKNNYLATEYGAGLQLRTDISGTIQYRFKKGAGTFSVFPPYDIEEIRAQEVKKTAD